MSDSEFADKESDPMLQRYFKEVTKNLNLNALSLTAFLQPMK